MSHGHLEAALSFLQLGAGSHVTHALRKVDTITSKSCNLGPQDMAVGPPLGGGGGGGTSISPAAFSLAFLHAGLRLPLSVPCWSMCAEPSE